MKNWINKLYAAFINSLAKAIAKHLDESFKQQAAENRQKELDDLWLKQNKTKANRAKAIYVFLHGRTTKPTVNQLKALIGETH